MAQYQPKTKRHTEVFVQPVSGQTRNAALEERVRGQHGNTTRTKHCWHFCSITLLKWACERTAASSPPRKQLLFLAF